MAYIGNTPAENYASFLTETFTVSATASYTLSHAVSNENDIRLVINGVVQQPGSGKAYTASGTTLTLTSATVSGDVMYAVYLGRALQTVNPPNASVGLSQLSATGTKDATTFLRGDNTFASAGGDNTPAFMAESDVGQGTSNATDALIQYNLERYDTDSAYDNTSGNYKFTVPSGEAGKYFFSASLNAYNVSVNNSILEINIKLFKNGSQIGRENLRPAQGPSSGSTFHAFSVNIQKALDLSVGDYIQAYGNVWVNSGTATLTNNSNLMQFQGFKLIGV